MLKISLIEFFLRGIPEAFLLFLAIYMLCFKNVRDKSYIISSIIYSLSGYFVRMLPISAGVHTIILIMICILICIYINGISTNEAIIYSFMLMLILLVCEMINIFAIENLTSINILVKNHLTKIYIFYPSLILFISIIYLMCFIKQKRVI